ncbi:hypothetical protein [Alteromonas ponticola]|uniref:PEP-CTERM sorting domain-containing protein n=1 Tax=Alteromonas ponticola TaxID=2720613 RepID=A0ABX1R0H3_9ALTE|nr:hypothetical protein [Alteromonas ponticola]NMH59574.1 hypothetical protein [Alteromonas ponticola]
MKNKLIKGVVVSFALSICTLANAGFIYDVNIEIGSERMTGTVETDGTLGFLTASNFIDVSLILNGAENLVFDYFDTIDSLFTAHVDRLTFDFINDVNGSTIIWFSGNSIDYLCFNDSEGLCDATPSHVTLGYPITSRLGGVDEVWATRTVEQVLEPSSLVIFALSLLTLVTRQMGKKFTVTVRRQTPRLFFQKTGEIVAATFHLSGWKKYQTE